MKKLITILFLLPFTVLAQKDTIASGGYNWKQPAVQKNKISAVVLVEGKAHDFEWMQLSANTINATKEIMQQVPSDYEELIIVKSGSIAIRFNDSVFLLTPNSTAVLMPGQKFTVKNTANEGCDFYTMKYRGKASQENKKMLATTSFVKIWEDQPFKPNTIGGGKRDFFECGTVMQKRFEIHVSTLKEGIRSHDPHRHKAEEIVLLIEGDTEMQIGEQFKKVEAGGFYYLGSNVLHAIKNTGTKPCTYFAIQFE
ncbi:cupin domain-containing protein [Ferruginibacter sp. SUN106]|uniref:cupin domain-containing protein n=1 Tax=Ferruginibacter sp. SUN106 TaxID=2978348 RepID=UPI003D36091B